MSLEKNKAIVRRLIEALNKHNPALPDKLIASDYFDHAHQLRGLEEYKQFITMFDKGFPDIHETIEDIIAEDNKVWVRTTITGTHTGDFRGLTPTSKKITIKAVKIFRIVDGKVVENWICLNN